MHARFTLAFILVLVAALGGCLTLMPLDHDLRHLEIEWRSDIRSALADAKRLDRPLLHVGAAGDITGFC